MLTQLEKEMQEKYYLEFDSHGLICPFHDDRRGGSFKFSIYQNEVRYKCFSCNESGNEKSLRNKIYQKNFKLTEDEAAIIYKKYRECTPEEKKVKIEYYKKIDAQLGKIETKKSTDSQVVFTPEEMDLIHSFYDRVISQTRLSRKDKEYLLQERLLTEDEIAKYAYRSFNTFSIPVIEKVIELFKEFKETAEMLRIPGLYLDEDEKVIKFKSINGLVIPIIQNGKYVGLQVRSNSNNPNALRYFWISSVDKGGTSPGAQWYSVNELDLSLPWIITEGQFKAASIHKHLQAKGKSANVISIQGIGNGNNLARKINELYNEDDDIERTLITLALDRDTVKNDDGLVDEKVIAKIKNIHSWMQNLNTHSINVMHWESLEKGIDDVLISNPETTFSYIAYEDYTKVLYKEA